MNSKRVTSLAVLLCLAGILAPWSHAQDEPEPTASDVAEEEGGVGFFGDRFALYLETAYGGSSPESYNTTIQTTNTLEDLRSINTMDFDDFQNAQFKVGWTLPYDRGALELAFDGYREDGFTVTALGQTDAVANAPGLNLFEPITWWTTTMTDGQYVSRQFPPSWIDENGNNQVDPGEIRYPADPAITSVRDTVSSLDNQWQTWDVLYRRGFGGRRFAGRWSAGARYFVYEGNLIAPAWLGGSETGIGFTDGAAYTPLTFALETTGIGPTGSMGFLMRFFRERLVLSLDGRVAFVLSTLKSDSGNFAALVALPGTGYLYTAPARLDEEVQKDVWHVEGTFGVTWRIVGGLSVGADYYRTAYQDVLLITDSMSIPRDFTQAQGRFPTTAALYTTTDLRVDGWRFRLRFEF